MVSKNGERPGKLQAAELHICDWEDDGADPPKAILRMSYTG